MAHSCTAAFSLQHSTSEAYIDFKRLREPSRSALQKTEMIMILTSVVRALRAWRRYNASLNELNRLGDRELADIGLSRSDIPRVAWESARV
jgi:uncharacterized protein YjiS (DUF1127 family)